MVMLAIGIVQVVNGLVALARTDRTFLTPSGLSIQVSYAGVGMSFVIMGVVLAVSGAGVLAGRAWARAVAIVLAVISVLTNVALFTAYPLWSSLVIVLDLIVIYALAAHGREVRS
jgi:hypothetical protein